MHPNFGINRLKDDESMVRAMIKKAPFVSQLDTEFGLEEAYETDFHIFDHLNNEPHPFNTVKLHDTEQYYKNSALYFWCERYLRLNIKDLFNLSLIEYLRLPTEYATMLTDLTGDHNRRKQRAEEQSKQDAEKESRKVINSIGTPHGHK